MPEGRSRTLGLRRVGAGALLGAIAIAVLVVGFAGFTVAGIGGSEPPHRSGPATAPEAATKHRSAVQRYSEEISVREGGASRTLSEAPPIKPARFVGPIRRYLGYAAAQAVLLRSSVGRLEQRIRAGSRAGARAAWRAAFARYLHLGAVYGAFGDLDGAIDGQASGLPRGTRDARFTGLHRIELGLWRAAPVRSLEPIVTRLARDVRRLRRAIPTARIEPLDYATRAHEILEDAQRDFLSGVDVPWSGEGVIATNAGLAATSFVISTLRPLLGGRDSLDPVLLGLSRLRATVESIRRAHHDRLPPLSGLQRGERERLDGALSWALERLQRIPGSLETTDAVQIPRLRTP